MLLAFQSSQIQFDYSKLLLYKILIVHNFPENPILKGLNRYFMLPAPGIKF